ncbi:CAP domain-containing protein [Salipaludibacillus daqingensis]|uniref:CAP domain-containing protein n=1 Tax=Salipaludibacillus daqingensis TaxID=3041001 RepID=UPI002473D920|nr:CAP domain-containing protein [Salipaludibacillus daqingensis]
MKKIFKGFVALTVAFGLFAASANATEARGYSHFDEPPFDSYKVSKGDSFFYIGQRYGVRTQKLMDLNPDVDPYNMQIGSSIKLVDNKVSNDSNDNSSFANAYEQEVLKLVNQERQNRGIQSLKMDNQVGKVARAKSQDMSDNNYFSHTSPTYGSPFDMLRHYGVNYRAAAENIAAGQRSPQQVVNSWMNSPGHRQNILNGTYTHIGIGYVNTNSQYSHYWTQLFISK